MKYIVIILFVISYSSSFAQQRNWQNLDLTKDGCFGASVEKAHNELLKGKRSKTVIVAVIDSGIDTAQEDLRAVLWTNPADGTHGWNYIGPEAGQEDITQMVAGKRDFYDSLAYTTVPDTYRQAYQIYRRLLVPNLEDKVDAMGTLVKELQMIEKVADSIVWYMGITSPTTDDFKRYPCKGADEQEVIKRITRRLFLYADWKAYRYEEIERIIQLAQFHLLHGLNLKNGEGDPELGDTDISPDKLGPVEEPNLTAYHGTHVAGIIGGIRNNGVGLNGIADNVRIMALKLNGTIREVRDKSLARAIRFAVDHGAKVINLSFGKPYSWDKRIVDEAVKYAMQKDVLLVHAAGNAGENLDKQDHYPNPAYADASGKAEAWLEVGASGPKDDSTLAAEFSNYGKRDVDVFAPGVGIYSTLPFNQYQSWDGTSMAAPMVTGVAALIREYYPKLTAIQVKDIILHSVLKVDHDVLIHGQMIPFSSLCSSGGIVNAYNALKLAAAYQTSN